jgi:hypothetical protein
MHVARQATRRKVVANKWQRLYTECNNLLPPNHKKCWTSSLNSRISTKHPTLNYHGSKRVAYPYIGIFILSIQNYALDSGIICYYSSVECSAKHCITFFFTFFHIAFVLLTHVCVPDKYLGVGCSETIRGENRFSQICSI